MKQPTRQDFKSWTEKKKIQWLAVETKKSGAGLKPGEPCWVFYKETDFSIRFTWMIKKKDDQVYLKDVYLMSMADGLKTFNNYVAGLRAMDNTNWITQQKN